jgi:hypothetical protein
MRRGANLRKSEITMNNIKKKINSLTFRDTFKRKKEDFTRNRKLPFRSLFGFILQNSKQTIQKELTRFMERFTKHENVSKSAFSQQRIKLMPEAFIELNDDTIHTIYDEDDTFKMWNGFRLTAIDGSQMTLPRTSELIDEFGEFRNNTDTTFPAARISSFYDILNEIIIDARMGPLKESETQLQMQHMDKVKKFDLIIYDRGYPSHWLFFYLSQIKNANFVIRVTTNLFKDFWKSSKTSEIVEIKSLPEKSAKRLAEIGVKFKPFKIRLEKIFLENGEVEVLATSLLEVEKYPSDIFKDLYFKRWGVETNYDHLKNNVEIENFTGTSVFAIKQDFYASILISNLQAIFASEQNDILEENKLKSAKKRGKRQKYAYKINRNLSLGYLKENLLNILMDDDPNYLQKVKDLFLIEPVPIRPSRKFQRNTPKRNKYPINQKRCS